MPLLTWWRSDPLPALPARPDLAVAAEPNDRRLAALAQLPHAAVRERLAAGHQPYMARVGAEPVAYGWVARQAAWVGELQHHVIIPAGHRYLWDFATLPAWRGQGIYPHLLQAILVREQAERFWIMHAPENNASGRGIQKAGFQLVGTVSFLTDGRAGLAASAATDRALEGAAFLGVPLLDAASGETLAPCWSCTVVARERATGGSTGAVVCGVDCACGES
jgi:ribosomal protein S18 acetylase RimI-like enzyme